MVGDPDLPDPHRSEPLSRPKVKRVPFELYENFVCSDLIVVQSPSLHLDRQVLFNCRTFLSFSVRSSQTIGVCLVRYLSHHQKSKHFGPITDSVKVSYKTQVSDSQSSKDGGQGNLS